MIKLGRAQYKLLTSIEERLVHVGSTLEKARNEIQEAFSAEDDEKDFTTEH